MPKAPNTHEALVQKEYLEFISGTTKEGVPQGVQTQFWKEYAALREVEKVTWGRLVTKSLVMHGFASLFTLSICPQFDYRLAHWARLDHIFMHWGEGWCSFWCGVLYMSVTALVLPGVLSAAEVKKLKPWWSVGVILLSVVSLLVFTVLGGSDIWDTLTFLWIFGAVLGAQVIFSGLTWFRARLTGEAL
jgi:hypothetical protein